MSAEITRSIDIVVKDSLAPLLKSERFKKHGQRFIRESPEYTEIVEVRKWKYNVGSEGKFGIDLGIYFPSWDEHVNRHPRMQFGDPKPKIPAVWCCYIQGNLEAFRLPPSKREQWEIDATTDLKLVGADARAVFESHGLGWLKRKTSFRNSVLDLAERALGLGNTWFDKVVSMIGCEMLGEKELAQRLFSAAVADELKKGETMAAFGSWIQTVKGNA